MSDQDTFHKSSLKRLLILVVAVCVVCGAAIAYIMNSQFEREKSERFNSVRQNVLMAKNILSPIMEKIKAGELSRQEALDQTRAQVRNMVFDNKDFVNYIFMVGYDGVTQVIPLQPELEGRDHTYLQDANGKYFTQEFIKIAKSEEGEGYCDYLYVYPGSGRVEPKVSYIVGLPELQCFLGSGVYMVDIEKHRHMNRIYIGILMLLTFAGIGIPVLISFQEIISRNKALMEETSRREQAQKKLQENETLFRSLFDQSFHFIGMIDRYGSVLKVNRTALNFIGIEESEVIGKKFWETPWWSHSQDERDRIRRAVERSAVGSFLRFETTHPSPVGGVTQVEISFKPVREEKGVVTGIMVEGRDISAIRESESLLRDSEKKYRELHENMRDGYGAVDLDGYLIDANRAFLHMLGYSFSELIGKNLRDITPERHYRNEMRIFAEQVMSRGYSNLYEKELIRKDGSLIPIELRAYLKKNENGKPECIYAMLRDISKRKLALDNLKVSRQRLQLAIEGARIGLWDWDIETGSCSFSEFWGEMTNLKISQASQDVELWLGRLHPEDEFRVRQSMDNHLGGNSPSIDVEYRLRTGTGKYRWFSAKGRVVKRDEDGAPLRAAGTQLDINDRMIIEGNLHKSQELYRAVVDEQGDFIFRHLPDGTITFMNESLCRLTGRERKDILGTNVFETSGAIDRHEILGIISTLKPDSPDANFEQKWTNPSGRKMILFWSIHGIFSKDGELLEIQSVGHDITKMRTAEEENAKLQEQLRQAEKMQAIGQLAGGIAHDFNNLLGGMIGMAELIRMKSNLTEDQQRCIDAIIDTGARATELIEQLMTFSRKGTHQVQPVDLHDLARKVVGILSHIANKKVKVKTELKASSSHISGDPSLLQNAMLNLAINACDAMTDGGELVIKTDTRNLVERELPGNPDFPAGHYIVLSVRDSGVGMDEDTVNRIFEPFFTTKPEGKGTGLGLASVHGCVQLHHGAIEVQSIPHHGTTFEMFLPLPDRDEEKNMSIDQALEYGKGKILLADDEEVIRLTASETLSILGYEVTVAVDGQDAVDKFKKEDGKFDLVILDMLMPRLNGIEAFREMKKISQDIKVMIASGYSNGDDDERLRAEGILDIVRKPVRASVISRQIKNILARGQKV